VQSNKADSARIAGKTGQIMEALIVSTRGKSGADVDPYLERDIDCDNLRR